MSLPAKPAPVLPDPPDLDLDEQPSNVITLPVHVDQQDPVELDLDVELYIPPPPSATHADWQAAREFLCEYVPKLKTQVGTGPNGAFTPDDIEDWADWDQQAVAFRAKWNPNRVAKKFRAERQPTWDEFLRHERNVRLWLNLEVDDDPL
jgi:hypothetical protein